MNGIKRLIASVLAAIAAGLESSGDPFLLLLAQAFRALATLLGVVGVAQAAVFNVSSLKKYALSTLAVIITIVHYIPAAQPWEILLRDIQVILAGAAVGQKIGQSQQSL